MGVINGVPNPPYFQDFMSIHTPFGLLTSPASRIAAYVCSAGAWDGAPVEVRNATVPTLDAGLALCRPNMQDIVYVLPTHAENVTATACILASQVAGARVIGIGRGTLRPTFTWTATAGIWNVTVANMQFENLRLVAAANGVVNSVLLTGTDTLIVNCEFLCATSAVLYSLIPVQVAATAHRSTIANCRFYTTGATGAITECINVVGAVDSFRLANCEFNCACATSLLVNVAGAATNLSIRDSHFSVTNATAAAIGVVNLANAVSTGFIDGCKFYNVIAGNANVGGVVFNAGASQVLAGVNYNCDTLLASGALSPAASA